MGKKSWSKWTPEVIEQFRLDYPCMPWEDLVNKYSSPKSSIVSKGSELGLRRKAGRFAKYTRDEDEIIKRMYLDGEKDDSIASVLHRDASAVRVRRQRLGLFVGSEKWAEWEDEILIANYNIMPAEDVSKMLNARSRNAVVSHAKVLGLTGYKPYHEYTADEELFIADNYLSMSDDEIAEILGHPRASIKNRRNKMGLHRPKFTTKYESATTYFRKYNFDWKKASIEQCDYRCVISGKRFDDIHHLVSLNTIVTDACNSNGIDLNTFDPNCASESERKHFLDVVTQEQSKYPLGVCLSRDIHVEFHREYGYGDNTPEQFYAFICDHYPERKSA